MGDDWDYDFLPPGLGFTDLADPQQMQEPDQGLRDPWFETAHAELFADWRRASRGRSGSLGGRRLSGKARRCSNQGPNGVGGLLAPGARRGSGGGGKENQGAQQLMGPPPPKEPPRKSMGAKRSRAHMTGAAQQQQQEQEQEAGVYDEDEAMALYGYGAEGEGDAMDVVDAEGEEGYGVAGRGGGAMDDHAMRMRLEEFRMAKQMGKAGTSGGARHLQHTKASAAHGGAAPAAAAATGAARKPAVPRQAQRGNVGAGASAAAGAKPRLAASSASAGGHHHNHHHAHKGGAAAAAASTAHGRGGSGAGTGKRGVSAAAAAAAAAEDEEMKALVARHNKKFKSNAPAYVPTLSIRDTRKWEEVTGKSYRALNYADREQANNEIKAMKAAEAQAAEGHAGGRGGRGR